MEFHPLANTMPLIEGADFEDLVASIKKNGLINPIILLDGKILDGRNRYRACLAAGVQPDYSDFQEADPAKQIALVEALNLHRRHLNESQRAIIAARLVAAGQPPEAAARAMRVSERTVAKAKSVINNAPSNVVELVQAGKVSVSRAEVAVRRSLPVSEMLADRQRGQSGRPRGNGRVTALRRIIGDIEVLSLHLDELMKFWPGDPELNKRLVNASGVLASVVDRAKEQDHARSVA